jgi:hypothetical protein
MPEFPSQDDLVIQPGNPAARNGADSDQGRRMLDFVSDLRKDFVERDKMYKLIDQVIYLQQGVQIPENFRNTAVEVRSPMPTHIANSITAALSINNPTVHFNAIEFGDVGEENAAYRSKFFEAAWTRQQREKRRRLHRIFMHSVVTKGEGILKTHERKQRAWAKYVGKGQPGDDDYEEGFMQKALRESEEAYERGDLPDEDSKSRVFDKSTEEYKRGLPYPIETTDIPPETFYYQKGEDGFVRIAEVKAVPYYEALKRYGRALDGKGQVCLDDIAGLALPDEKWGDVFASRGTSKTIEMVELWDSEYCTVILRGPGDLPTNGTGRTGSGQVVKRYKHGYGDPHLGVLRGPYFHAPGIITSSREPHKAHLSVLFAYLHLFPLLNALLTMQSQAAFSFAYPAYRRTTPPNYGLPDVPFGYDASDLSSAREKLIPGAIFPHDIAPMDQPHTSVDLDKAINFVRQLIDMALPDAVQGVITGETAGYALNQAAHLASLAWSPIVDNVEDCLSDRVGWESELIETRIGEPVYVWGAVPQPRRRPGQPRQYKDGWMGIGPKDLKGVHNYTVKLEPASVNNETLKLRVIEQKLQMRLIAPADAIREIGGNPVEVEKAWLLHEIKQDPEIRKNLKQRIFFGLATIEQESMQQLPPDAQPGGAPPDVPALSQPAGAQPGISQGIPTTGFVPPQGAVPQPPQGQPGTPTGAPGGIPGPPAAHAPIPGEGQ